MKQVMVRYEVKPEHAARNEALVRRVYEELEQTAPQGFQYATFVLDDGVSFVHLASFQNDEGPNTLTDIAAFRAFQEGIEERCDKSPRVTDLREIGSYGHFTAANNVGETAAIR